MPQAGLDLFAVGMERFERAIDEELDGVAAGRAAFKAVRGEYGAGKTFFARWLAERAKRRGMAAAEIQISETETPLHKLETVYRRLVEQLSTAAYPPSALREIVDAWFYTLEEDVLAEGADQPRTTREALAKAVDELLERRLADVARTTPAFAAALRAYRKASAGRGPGHRAGAASPGSAASPTSRPPPAAPPASRATSTTSPRSASCRACSRSCATPAIPGCSSCSTRSRPSSGSAPTCATRASTRCGSSSTTSTPAGSPACTC